MLIKEALVFDEYFSLLQKFKITTYTYITFNKDNFK